MPKTRRDGEAKPDELPGPVERSGKEAQKTFAHTYDSALEQYGEEGRAHATAYAALKRTHEKVGDHWEQKPESGPSDARAEKGGLNHEDSAGGVDANATKKHLLDIARRLDVPGRSRMDKAALVDAIQRANDRATAQARENES